MNDDDLIKIPFEKCVREKISRLEEKYKVYLQDNNMDFSFPCLFFFEYKIDGKSWAKRTGDYGEEINKEIEDILNKCIKSENKRNR